MASSFPWKVYLGNTLDLTNSIMGVAFVSLPFATLLLRGPGISTVVMLVYLLLNLLTLLLMVYLFLRHTTVSDFGALLRMLVGRWAGWLYDVCVIISMLGTLCGILAVLTTIVQSFGLIATGFLAPWTPIYGVTAAIFLVLVLPASMMPRIAHLRTLNIISTLVFIVGWLLVLILGGKALKDFQEADPVIPEGFSAPLEALTALGVICFAFTSQMNAIPIFFEVSESWRTGWRLRTVTREQQGRRVFDWVQMRTMVAPDSSYIDEDARGLTLVLVLVVVSAVALSGLFYVLIGCLGFQLFRVPGAVVGSNILLVSNYYSGVMAAAQLLIMLKLLATFPIFVHPLVNSFWNLFLPWTIPGVTSRRYMTLDESELAMQNAGFDVPANGITMGAPRNRLDRENFWHRALVVAPLLAIVGVLSYYNTDLNIFFGLSGAFADSFISLLFPTLAFVVLVRQEWAWFDGEGILTSAGFTVLLLASLMTAVSLGTTALTLTGLIETYLIAGPAAAAST